MEIVCLNNFIVIDNDKQQWKLKIYTATWWLWWCWSSSLFNGKFCWRWLFPMRMNIKIIKESEKKQEIQMFNCYNKIRSRIPFAATTSSLIERICMAPTTLSFWYGEYCRHLDVTPTTTTTNNPKQYWSHNNDKNHWEYCVNEIFFLHAFLDSNSITSNTDTRIKKNIESHSLYF